MTRDELMDVAAAAEVVHLRAEVARLRAEVARLQQEKNDRDSPIADALDAIWGLFGYAKSWEYPGQVAVHARQALEDVKSVDRLRAEVARLEAERAAIVAAVVPLVADGTVREGETWEQAIRRLAADRDRWREAFRQAAARCRRGWETDDACANIATLSCAGFLVCDEHDQELLPALRRRPLPWAAEARELNGETK